jgi:Lipase (class 3)
MCADYDLQYTFGSPQIGMQTTANYISNQPGGVYRVTHTDDIVPKLPGVLLGYRHVGTEYFITSGNNVPVTSRDITVIQNSLFAGNQATWTSSVDAHGWYFNPIGACAPPGYEFRN